MPRWPSVAIPRLDYSSLDADDRKWSKSNVISPIAVPSPGDSDPVGCGILIYSVYG